MDMFDLYNERQAAVKALFSHCSEPSHTYSQLIAMGRSLSPLSEAERSPQALVPGCQSRLYLIADMREGLIFFRAHTDALISAGLAALLISVYSGCPPEMLLHRPPLFLKELNIPQSLSIGRAGGLASLWLRMQQEAVKFSGKGTG